MKNRLVVLPALLLFLSTQSATTATAARTIHPNPASCGPPSASNPAEPPDVRVWTLPLNAAGEHELILAVHRDGPRFCYTYAANGTTGIAPTIRVRRGEHFALRIVNDIARSSPGEGVPSTAISQCMPMAMAMGVLSHFPGYLNHTINDRYMVSKPLDVNIHLHGFQGPASQENVFLSTLSTPMRACEYSLTIPRTQPPGTYFYHPHVHMISDQQVAGGLSGVWIVEPDSPQIARENEHVVVLRYRSPYGVDYRYQLDTTAWAHAAALHQGSLRRGAPVAFNPFDPPAWPLSFPISAGGISMFSAPCDGVAAETLISVNGADTPSGLDVAAGSTQLLRLVNATSDSPKMIELHDASGHSVPMHVVAKDGTPVSSDPAHPLARYVAMNRVMLEPAGRADILVTASAGETLTLASAHFCEGLDAFYQLPHDLLRVRGVAGPAPVTVASSPQVGAQPAAAALVGFARAHPNLIRRRSFAVTEYQLPKSGNVPEHQAYYIVDLTNKAFHEEPFWPAYAAGSDVPDADVVVKSGTVEEWYLFNTTMEAHVFHIHQMSFVSEAGADGPATNDVLFVPVGTLLPNRRDPNYPLVRPSMTKVLMDFRHVPRGTFVFHCHMLYHEDHGMMTIIRVV